MLDFPEINSGGCEEGGDIDVMSTESKRARLVDG